MNRILITGGFGFLGGRIAKFLSSNGFEIYLGSRKRQDIPYWLKNAKPVVINWDSVQELSKICENVNYVIHTAGMNSEDSIKNPILAFEFNVLNTMKLIEASYYSRVKKFIYLSTAHVYSSPLVGLISEDTCPKNLHPYATSNLSAEFAVAYANSKNYFRGYNLRISNGFGAPSYPDVNCWNLLVNGLCRQAIENRILKLNSSGEQERDFIPIKNISSIIRKLIQLNQDNVPNLLNVGSGVSMKVIQMAFLIQKRCNVLFGYTPRLEIQNFNDDKTVEPLEYSISRLMDFGLSESCNLEDELDQLLLFCDVHFGK